MWGRSFQLSCIVLFLAAAWFFGGAVGVRRQQEMSGQETGFVVRSMSADRTQILSTNREPGSGPTLSLAPRAARELPWSFIRGAEARPTFAALGEATLFQSVSGPHIIGVGKNLGWKIDVVGSKGTFALNGQVWDIEGAFKWLGQDGFSSTLVFLGRKGDDFILPYVYCNVAGKQFVVWYFDYRSKAWGWDVFDGDYSISGMVAAPSVMKGYVPKGKVPDYDGRTFKVESEYTHLTQEQGVVKYGALDIKVYPLMELDIVSDMREYWCVGVSADGSRAYYLDFYNNQPYTWVVDLEDGGVSLLGLGQVVETGTQRITFARNVILGH